MNRILKSANKASRLAFCAVVISSILGCGGVPLARYDASTYQSLTFEKPEILAVYDTFKVNPVDDSKVSAADLKLAQIHEYEVGKPGNVDMAHQVENIQKMFDKHVAERRRDGPWSDVILSNHIDSISEVFDIAIKTEQAKNK